MKEYLFILLVLCFCFADMARGQMVGDQRIGADSVSSSIFPVVSYSSNEGFVGGALFNRYDYSGNVQPFHSYLESSALVSTKGFVEVVATFERTRSFNRQIRSLYDVFVRRYNTDIFFGVGNNTTFSNSRWQDDYYYFESISVGFNYRARKAIYENDKSQLDVQAGLGTQYEIPYVRNDSSSFAQQTPLGNEGGWINYLNAGMIWENRDSEFDPHRGNRAELELRMSPEFASSYGLASARLELRQYFYLFNWLTVANRLETRVVTGDVPYWELSTLGGSNNLRGYPLNRFMGKSSLAYTLELRGWFLKFPELENLKFGGHLFTDTGRVFTGSDDVNDLFEGYKQTYGFGGTMSVFHPDLILRGEMGFSEDVSRIYIGVGYLF